VEMREIPAAAKNLTNIC